MQPYNFGYSGTVDPSVYASMAQWDPRIASQFDGNAQLPANLTGFTGGSPDAPGGGGGWSILDRFGPNGQKTGQGVGGMALGAANGIFNAYMGLKQYGLAKDQFAESKRQFGLNFGAQARTTNASLADRQAARLSAGGDYASVADYMSKYGIQGG